MEISIPKKIAQYSLLQKIGRGSTADVWSAKDQHDQSVALKIYSKIKHLDEVAHQLFKDEFEKTKLLSHPHVLSAQEFIIEDETPILSFPLYESCLEKEIIRRKIDNLEQNIDNPSFFSNEDIFAIARQVAEGLAYLHENNIIHNDIKPANIVFRKTHEGHLQCSIIDFGISLDLKNYTKSAYQKDIASSKTVVYAAPEKINGINTEPKSDIFSLGMVIYELAGGKNKSITAGDIIVKGGLIKLEDRVANDPIQMLMSACLKKPLKIDRMQRRFLQ
ncbi:MAG: serine/threonine protein kinase [Saprospiraceae bacterium]|nr:serine/threonine protein kinase [Saprospiraceae bacterium]